MSTTVSHLSLTAGWIWHDALINDFSNASKTKQIIGFSSEIILLVTGLCKVMSVNKTFYIFFSYSHLKQRQKWELCMSSTKSCHSTGAPCIDFSAPKKFTHKSKINVNSRMLKKSLFTYCENVDSSVLCRRSVLSLQSPLYRLYINCRSKVVDQWMQTILDLSAFSSLTLTMKSNFILLASSPAQQLSHKLQNCRQSRTKKNIERNFYE